MTDDLNRQDAKDSKGRLPDGWRCVRLGEVCSVHPGQHILESDYNRESIGIGYLTGPADFGLMYPSVTKWTNKPKAWCEPGDILVTVKGAGVGKANLAPEERVAIGRQLMAVRPKRGVADRRFIYCFILMQLFNLQSRALGSTVPGLGREDLESLAVPLPPISDQQRIAAILNEQMAAVERARAAAEPRLEAAKALPAAYLRAVFNSPEAQKWSKKRLGDILRLRKEVVHPRDNPTGRATFVGLEHLESVTGRRIGAVEVDMATLTGRKPRFYKGDIVYGYLRPYLNKVWVAELDGLCSVDQYVYSVDQTKARTEFVGWFMRSPVYLTRAPIGFSPGQLPRIRTEEVSSVEINLPSLEEQEQIGAMVNARLARVDRGRKTLEEELAAINALPAALLRRAFSGEL